MKFKETKIGTIPTSWEVKPIKEITEIVTDYVANGSFASLAENVTYKDEEDVAVLIRLVDYNNDFQGKFVFIDEHAYEFLGKSKLYGDEIIISNVGANVGTVFRCPKLKYKMSLAPNSIMVKFKGNDDFYFHWLRGYNGQQMLKSIVTGSAQPKFNKTNFKEMLVPVPPIKEQNKIATILNTIDEKISINKKINNNLEQQAQAIFKSWFIDFEPFDKTKPSDWTIGTIDDLAKDVVCGKTPSTKKVEYYGSDIPFVTIPDMHGKIYTVTTERYLSKLGASSQAKKSLPKNSVCVSCIGTAGLVTLVAEESQTNQQINSIIPKDGFSPYYIYLLMQTLSDTINKLGQSGSTIVNLNKSQFGKIQVNIPALSTMIKFDETISPIFEKILQSQKENLNLTSLRDTLLPKLMSGELDVSDIEI